MAQKKKGWKGEIVAGPVEDRSPVPFAILILLLAFLLPNVNALWCGFVLDDLPLIVENERVHALSGLPVIWTSGYWPDRKGLALYRPLTMSVWAALWQAGAGSPLPFHLLNLLLGALIPCLLWILLLEAGFVPLVAFTAAFLFALFPIHTEATTSVVGSAELLAAAFGISALISFRRGHRVVALALFALAVASKESAAAIAGLAPFLATRPRKRFWPDAVAAAVVIAAALWARSAVTIGKSFIPPIDNPLSLVSPGRRILAALWVQSLYIWKTFVPITLSADYSYRQIPLVMNLADGRAWGGIALVAAALITANAKRHLAIPILCYAILFSPAANILFPIGTVMGERLSYLPGAALALIAALVITRARRISSAPAENPGTRETAVPWAQRNRRLVAFLGVVALAYGLRTAVRNRDWRDATSFYESLVETSPESSKAHYFLGTLRASEGDDARAVAIYDRAVAIFPAYSEALHNRGNALSRLGRYREAMESYRQVLRFDPGHAGARQNLQAIEAGVPISPTRRKL